MWNAFEEHLVPESDAAFYGTLPLTAPAGLVSILTDTFLVHPVQVMPDAWGDTRELWENIEWEQQYYTELATLPFRTVGSPIVLVGSFLGRSAFDIAPRGGRSHAGEPRAGPTQEQRQRELERQQESARRLLERASARKEEPRWLNSALRQMQWPPWNPALDQAWERAVTESAAEVRMQLFEIGRRQQLPPWSADPVRGLRDPSAVVRYQELRDLPHTISVPPGLIAALLSDPDEAVRDQARLHWPKEALLAPPQSGVSR